MKIKSGIFKFLVLFFVFGFSFSKTTNAFTLISNAGKLAYWPSHSATYQFHTNTSGYFSGGHDASGTSTDEFDPIRNAFAEWEAVGGISLSLNEEAFSVSNPSSSDGKNSIMWVTSGWRSLSFQPPSNALAVTLLAFNSGSGAIVNADIYFNAQYFGWSDIDSDPAPFAESSYIDVQNIATHEIGHLLGLDHSSETIGESDSTLKDATMFYASGSGETKRRSLNSDDIAGIRNLYSSTSASTPTITSVERLSTSESENVFRVTGTNFNSSTEFVLTMNRISIYDSVSRYHTIDSATQATVHFDVEYFPSGTANLMAFNSPSASASYATDVIGGYYASDSGSGGGCAMSVSDQGLAWIWMIMSGILFFILFSYRFSRSASSQLKVDRKL